MSSTARDEARALPVMAGRNGETLEAVRELIAVPPEIEKLLRAYATFRSKTRLPRWEPHRT